MHLLPRGFDQLHPQEQVIRSFMEIFRGSDGSQSTVGAWRRPWRSLYTQVPVGLSLRLKAHFFEQMGVFSNPPKPEMLKHVFVPNHPWMLFLVFCLH